MRKRWILATAVVALFAASAMEAEAQCRGRRGDGLLARLRERFHPRQEEQSPCGSEGCSVTPGQTLLPTGAATPFGTLPVYVVEGGTLRQIGVISSGPTSMPVAPAGALPK